MNHLVVDGYNAVHAWPSLKAVLVRDGLEASRRRLIDMLAEYGAVRQVAITVVFDAHRRSREVDAPERVGAVTVRFGDRHTSADQVIERLCSEAARRGVEREIVVATSDRLERAIVSAMGVSTIAATTLEAEVRQAAHDVERIATGLRNEARAAGRVEHGLESALLGRLERLRLGLPEVSDDDRLSKESNSPTDA